MLKEIQLSFTQSNGSTLVIQYISQDHGFAYFFKLISWVGQPFSKSASGCEQKNTLMINHTYLQPIAQ
jgi:hypothetical protein